MKLKDIFGNPMGKIENGNIFSEAGEKVGSVVDSSAEDSLAAALGCLIFGIPLLIILTVLGWMWSWWPTRYLMIFVSITSCVSLFVFTYAYEEDPIGTLNVQEWIWRTLGQDTSGIKKELESIHATATVKALPTPDWLEVDFSDLEVGEYLASDQQIYCVVTVLEPTEVLTRNEVVEIESGENFIYVGRLYSDLTKVCVTNGRVTGLINERLISNYGSVCRVDNEGKYFTDEKYSVVSCGY